MLQQAFRHIERLVREQEALAVTEYAVMLSLIIVTALGALIALGNGVVATFRYEYVKMDEFIQ